MEAIEQVLLMMERMSRLAILWQWGSVWQQVSEMLQSLASPVAHMPCRE